jgi:hypothetical protein
VLEWLIAAKTTPSAVWPPLARATMNSTVLDLPALLPGQLVAWQSPVLYAAALALAALWLCSGRSSSQNGWAAIPGPAPASRLLGHVQQVSRPPGGLGGIAAGSILPPPPPASCRGHLCSPVILSGPLRPSPVSIPFP